MLINDTSKVEGVVVQILVSHTGSVSETTNSSKTTQLIETVAFFSSSFFEILEKNYTEEAAEGFNILPIILFLRHTECTCVRKIFILANRLFSKCGINLFQEVLLVLCT